MLLVEIRRRQNSNSRLEQLTLNCVLEEGSIISQLKLTNLNRGKKNLVKKKSGKKSVPYPMSCYLLFNKMLEHLMSL